MRAMACVAITGVVFVSAVSRLVLAPHDPLGCVSVLSCRLGWWIIPISAVLAFVFAALVCGAGGARLEEMGVFAVALGSALAVMRYEDAAFLWATIGQADDELRRKLAALMAGEALAWVVVVAAAYWGSLVSIKRLGLTPIISPRPADEFRIGAFTVLFMSIIAMLGLQLFSAGTELAPIQKGQVCFALALSFYLAALIAYQVTGAHSPVWANLAVEVVAVAGYVWKILHPTPSFPGRSIAHLAHLSPTVWGRALPVQTLMIGTAAAIFGNWHQRQLTRYAVLEDKK